MPIRSVLLIDDEPDIRTIGEISLSEVGGLEVCLAASGCEGVRQALAQHPDVILLDVMMPGVDGPATLRMLREKPETANIPVIFITAKAQRHEVARYLELGAAGVVSKPFDPLKLPSEIRAILRR